MRKRPFIVGMGGTARPGSSSERALRLALDVAEKAGAEVMCLDGAAIDLPIYDPNRADPQPAAQRLVEALRQADGVILATPCYHGSMSGLMKNALDYVEDMRGDPRPYLDGRSIGCIVTAYGDQAMGTTLTALRSVVHALRGWPTPYAAAINSAAGSAEEIETQMKQQTEIVANQVLEFASMRRLAEATRDAA